MRVLHIISGDLWAGAEVQAYTLLTASQRLGLTVAAVLMNDGELAQRLRTQQIPVTILSEEKLNALQILSGLQKLMRQWQPDIVHTHRIKENILGSIANRFAGNARSVRTVHGASEHTPMGVLQLHKQCLNYLNRWTGLHLQQKLIAVSRDLMEKLTAYFPSARLIVIENGVDIEAVRAQVRDIAYRELMPNAIHVGIVGRLVPVKRVDLFLEMATQLRAEQPHTIWHFHIFGDGPLKTQLIAQAEQLSLGAIVTFHGHRHDIVPCIAGLDALVMCSDHEGLPMTILEAMALQIPIAAHAVGGLVDALDGYPNGQLVSGHTAANYAEAVTRALNKPRELSTALLPERFSALGNARAIAQLYSELIAKPAHASLV